MASNIMQNLLLFILFLTGLPFTVSGSAFTTIIPCPSCPASLAPPAITVTAQYQPVSTCTTSVACKTNTFSLCSAAAACSTTSNRTCSTAVPCSTSLWLSTVIPCVRSNKPNQKCTITATDQLVTISQETSTSTSYHTVVTRRPHTFAKDRRYNGPELGRAKLTAGKSSLSRIKTTAKFSIVLIVRDFIVRFSQIGPRAIPGYGGSGICTTCGPSKDGSVGQAVVIRTCINNVCTSVRQVWVSHIVTITVPSIRSYVREVRVASNGLQTLTVAPQITAVTYISRPTTVTFVGTSQVVSENGVQTVTVVPERYTTVVVQNAPTTISLPSGTRTITTNGVYRFVIVEAIHFTYAVHNAPFTAYFPPAINIYETIGHYTITLAVGVYVTTIISNAPGTVTISTTVTTTVTTTTTATSTATATATTTATTTASPVTTSGPAPISTPIRLNGKVWVYNSCSSSSAAAEFSLVLSSSTMTPLICLSACTSYNYGGLHGNDVNDISAVSTAVADSQCNIPCPGDQTPSCGGPLSSAKLLKRQQGILLSIYENETNLAIISSSSVTQNPSMDMTVEPRSLETAAPGGLLKDRALQHQRNGLFKASGAEKVATRVQKRDLGIKTGIMFR